MATSIAEIRQANGGLENLTDEDILQHTFETTGSRYYSTIDDYARDMGYEGAGRGKWSARGSSAVDRYQAGLLGLGEAVTGAVGLEGASQFLGRQRQANESAADYSDRQVAEQGGIQRFSDVQGAGDLADYVGGLAVQSLPYAGEAIVGGLAARGLMTGTRAALTGARTAEQANTARTALNTGSAVGAVAASYPSAVGDILQNQREQAGETNLLSAAGLGVPYAALNAVGIEGALARGTLTRSGVQALDAMKGFGGAAARTGASAAKTAAVEGVAETGQEMVNQLGRMSVDEAAQFLSPEALERYKESFIAGGLLGGTFGAVGGGWRRTEEGGLDLTDPVQPVGLQDTGTLGGSLTGTAPESLLGSPMRGVGGESATQLPMEQTLTTAGQEQSAEELLAATETKPNAAKQILTPAQQRLIAAGVNPYQRGASKKATDVLDKISASGLPEDVTAPVLTLLQDSKFKAADTMLTKLYAEAELAKVRNVSQTTTPVSGAAGLLPTGGVDVLGGVGAAGLAPAGVGQSGADLGTVPTAGKANVVSTVPRKRAPTVAPTVSSTTPTVAVAPTNTAAPFEADTVDENTLEIARMTGQEGLANVVAQEQEGSRADEVELDEAAVQAVIEARLASSQNKDRDRVIINEYLAVLRAPNSVGKAALKEAIASKYGIKDKDLAKIGNPTELVKAAGAMGFSAEQARLAFNVRDTTKAAAGADATTTSQLKERLKKVNAKITNATAVGATTTPEVRLELQNQRISLESEIADATKAQGANMSAELATAGFTADEKGNGGFGMDDSRGWAELEAGATPATQIIALADKLDALENALAEFEALGNAEAVAQIRGELDKAQTALDAKMAQVNAQALAAKKGKPTDAKAATPKVVTRKQVTAPKVETPAATPDTRTTTERAEAAWNEVAATIPGAPTFADLPAADQKTFAGFGPDNWTRDDVVTELKRLSDTGGVKFGKSANAKKPYTAKELLAEIKAFIRADIPGRKLVVVDSVADLLMSNDKTKVAIGAILELEGAYGVASDGRAYLVANRIEQGTGRAKFMHEVGGHLGLDNLLTDAEYKELVDQIIAWAKKDDDSVESEAALNAVERVKNANTPKEDQRSEILAYFIEEAMLAGVDPTASGKESGPLSSWFRTLWAAFKSAVRKLGFKTESLEAQDVVNMAFGAARLEIAGTWHGTAASFRKFSHKFMNTGEGAQAYGWGTYLAQRVGIAKGYWSTDVRRKSNSGNTTGVYEQSVYVVNGKKYTYSDSNSKQANDEHSAAERLFYLERTATQTGRSVKDSLEKSIAEFEEFGPPGPIPSLKISLKWSREGAVVKQIQPGPEGTLMRVDTAVDEDTTLDWDAPLSKQPDVLEKIEAGLPESLREQIEDEAGDSVADMSGETFYRALEFVESRSGVVSDQFDVADYNKRLASKPTMQVVSTFLDEQLGVKGLTFFDANSRDGVEKVVSVNGKQYTRKDLVALKRTTEEIGKYRTTLRKILRSGVTTTAQTWELKVREQADMLFNNAKESAESFGVKFDAAAQRDKAEATAAKSYEGKQLAWLLENSADIEVVALNDNRTRNLVIFNDKNIFRVGGEVGADRQRMKFGKNERAAKRNIDKLPAVVRPAVGASWQFITDFGNRALDRVVFTSDLVDMAVKAGIPSARKFLDTMAQSRSFASELEREIEGIADGYALIEEKDKGSGPRSANQFLFESTRTGKWGYRNGSFKADPELESWFLELGPKSQKFVRDVFAHGDVMLARKKKIVLEATTSEFDAMIDDAQAAGDKDKVASLKKDKANSLTKFTTLFRVREGKPYAPIKRIGSHVVFAKSDAYITAVEMKDTKRIRELEQSGNDYQVTFVDSKLEARRLASELEATGLYGEVNFAERSEAVDSMFTGEALLPALTKLRSASNDVDGRSAKAQLREIVNQLYLEALAEASARKSEMRRRGISGQVDMLNSFTLQGRADAQFLASVQYSPKIQKDLRSVNKESRTGDTTRKSEIRNELLERYLGSLEYKVNPWVDTLTSLSSKYFLATSPGYYLQNLTQPFMMSLPAMAGRHDYVKAAKEMYKAYSELGPIMKATKLFDQQFDFSKVPDDVKVAIKQLVAEGKIDIGLATEISEYKVDADNKLTNFASKLNKGMRLAVQKAEAVNRLSTAMAAYRLELAKTGDATAATAYAGRILTETHGDYTSFNAPRAFNSSLGKVMLQFRKFQLIQLTFFTKLFREAFTNPKERAAALRTLSYTLGHTAVFAGMMGMPGYAAISAIAAALSDEDEPFDVTKELRLLLGPEWATLVLRGAPTLADIDLSGKIGYGNALSVMPFSNADLKTAAGRAEALGTLLGGASLGMATRVADGLGLMSEGDWYKGIERTMPKGISDMMKSGRTATEGMTRRNGDVILPADEVSSLGTIFSSIGLPSAAQAMIYENRQQAFNMKSNFTDRTSSTKRQYVEAFRDKDQAGMKEAREAWAKLQDAKRRNGVRVSPLSDLMRAPSDQAKRERDTVGGVQFTRSNRAMAEQIVQ